MVVRLCGHVAGGILKLLLVLAIAFAAFLTGCSGGGGTAPLSSSRTLSQGTSLASTTSAVESMARTYAASVPASTDMLYVSNAGNNTISVYKHDQQGNSAPWWIIGGSKTGISHPGQLAEDAAGNLYVANNSYRFLPQQNINSGFAPPAVLVFAPHAKGNVAPIRVLGGPKTGILSIDGMTVDQATGKIYVTSAQPDFSGDNGDPGANLIRFAPNSTGDATPFAIGQIGEQTNELAQDSSGQYLITFQTHSEFVSSQDETAIAKQFANNSAPSEPWGIADSVQFNGTADDPTTTTYLVTGSLYVCPNDSDTETAISGIVRFRENDRGRTAGSYSGCGFGAGPSNVSTVSVITSDTCGGQLVLGYLRNIYVVHSKSTGCPADAVYVYNHDAAGAAVPLRVLSGSATQLSSPAGIYEGK
jgi:hypothetical protein